MCSFCSKLCSLWFILVKMERILCLSLIFTLNFSTVDVYQQLIINTEFTKIETRRVKYTGVSK